VCLKAVPEMTYCVGRDVKPYSLTHCHSMSHVTIWTNHVQVFVLRSNNLYCFGLQVLALLSSRLPIKIYAVFTNRL